MIITKIERQKRHPHRVNLYLDDEFAFGLHDNVVVKYGLRKGDELDRLRVEEIEHAEEFNLAKEKAIRLLHYRARSEKELRLKLREQEFHPAAIDDTITQLRNLGVLNDKSFARSFIHDTLLKKDAGKAFFRRALRAKGIHPDTIHEVLGELEPTMDERTLALEAAEKILKRTHSSRHAFDQVKQQRRITGFLARRGFEWSTIHSVLNTLFKAKS